ncbi:MAG: amino acid permease [Deltaproteobacteria bacterium]|nr:amino acid permease [Deltaproteobacteria bacterium]
MGATDGSRAGLKRELGAGSAMILVIANMIGTGIFTTSGFIMEALGDPVAMLLCWVAGGVLALSGALCYGELGAMFPSAGGEYVYLRESMGRLPGFLSGWISLIVGFSAPIAAAAMAFASYFFRVFPKTFAGAPHTPFLELAWIRISPLSLFAVGVIVLFSLIHCYSLHLGSRVQNWLTVFKIGVILAFVGGGIAFGHGSMDHFSSGMGKGALLSTGFASSLIFISFAYSGWNAAAYLGAEIRNPARSLPLSLFWGTLSVMVLYLLLNVVFIYALPPSEMSGVLEVGAASAFTLFGKGVESIFAGAITFCLLSVISAMIMAGPRVYYAMARDHLFFARFGRVTRRHGAPAQAVFLQAAIAILMVITSSFDKLLLYIGVTLSLFAMLTIIGMMVLRAKGCHLGSPYRTFGYPITPLFFILFNLWMIVFFIKANPMVSLYSGGTIACGLVVFLCFNRKAEQIT